MKRKTLFVLIAISMLAFSSRLLMKPGSKTFVEIEFWTMQLSPILDSYITSSISEFEAEYPNIKVKWVDVAWADMERKLLSSVAGRTAPDVANLNPQFSSKLTEFDALSDPTEYLDAESISLYNPSVWESNKLNGSYFGVPWYLSTSVAIFNRSIFEAAGASFPASLEQIPAIGREIRRATGKYTYFPSFDSGESLENYVLLGGHISAEVPGFGLDEVSVVELLSYYVALYESGAVPPSALIESHQKAVDLFQSGQLAMLLSGMQVLRTIELNAPELVKDIVIRAHPNADQGQTNIAAMNLVVLKQSAHPQAAFDFVEFMTSPEKQAEMAKLVPILPSTPKSLSDSFFDLTDPNDKFQQARAASIEQIQNGRVLLPPLRKYSRLRTSFVLQIQKAMIGEVSLQTAADALVRDWKNISGEAHD